MIKVQSEWHKPRKKKDIAISVNEELFSDRNKLYLKYGDVWMTPEELHQYADDLHESINFLQKKYEKA